MSITTGAVKMGIVIAEIVIGVSVISILTAAEGEWTRYVPALAMAVAALVWLIRLEGRVNWHDQRFQQLDHRFDSLDRGVERIEQLMMRPPTGQAGRARGSGG